MNELIPIRRVPKLVEGEILRPETPLERAYADPMYFAANVAIPSTRNWNPSPFMRMLGYTRNPDTCRHGRKGFTPRDGWWCMECGESL